MPARFGKPRLRRRLLHGGVAAGLVMPDAPGFTAELPRLLRYGGDHDFEPFESLGADGQPRGFQIDLLNELARIGGFELQVRLDDWDQIESDFRAGRYDLIAMVATAPRAAWASFTRAHATPVFGIYHRAAERAPQSLQDLSGHRVAVADTAPMHDLQAGLLAGSGLQFVNADSALGALQAVEQRQADFALMPRAYGDALLAAGRAASLAGSPLNFSLQSYAFAVSPEKSALKTRLDDLLDQLERSGRLGALRARWLQAGDNATLAERPAHWPLLGGGIAAAALASAALLFVHRRRAVAARGQAEQALRQAEDKLRHAFTQHPDPMLIIDRESGAIEDANEALGDLLGLPAAELLGRDVETLPVNSEPGWLQALEDELQAEGSLRNASLQVRRSDGTLRDCLVSSEALSVDGRPRVFSIIRDVTESLRADESLRSGYAALSRSLDTATEQLAYARAAAASADKDMKTFTAIVAHDLRAPLRDLQGTAGLLTRNLEKGHLIEANANAGRIDQAARRMDGMVAALARLARTGAAKPRRQPVEMNELMHTAWRQASGASRVPIALQADILPAARGDEPMLAQLWQHLLDNACKFSARNAQPVVRVSSYEENGRTWYRVTDNGVGFDARQAGRLFKPFQQLHRAGEFPGDGMGLAIAQRIVQNHGGTIRAGSSLGKGTVIEFSLGTS